MPQGFINGQIIIPEITTPTAEASHGKIYTKTDNEFYFQDGAGTEHRIAVSDYAGIFADGNAGATTILLVDAYEPVTIFDTDMPELVSNGDNTNNNITIGATAAYEIHNHTTASGAAATKVYTVDPFQIAASGSTITDVTQATPGVVTATAHGFSDNDIVKITGVVGMTELNGQLYTVTNKADNTFELEDDNGTDIATGGYTPYDSAGTAFLATKIDTAHSHRSFGGIGVIGSMSGSGIANLTAGDALELYVKNENDANNMTIESVQLWIRRV